MRIRSRSALPRSSTVLTEFRWMMKTAISNTARESLRTWSDSLAVTRTRRIWPSSLLTMRDIKVLTPLTSHYPPS